MERVGIVGLGSYLPSKIMKNFDWEEIVETSDEWIINKTGIRERRIASDDLCTSDLAVFAAKEAMDNSGVNPEDIDLIILATSTPDVPLSSTAAIVQRKLGCHNSAAFDINAVCSGWVHALDIGSRFAGTSGYQNVLVIGSEIYSRILNWDERSTCVLFGDGAGAALLQKKKAGGVLGSWLKTDGRGSEVIQIPAGGIRIPFGSEKFLDDDRYFQMDGRAVWDFAVEAFPEAVHSVLQKVGMKINDVDFIISHQANLRIIEAGMKKLGLDMDKTFTNIERYGNTAGASIPIALKEAVEAKKIKTGNLVITVGFGGGLSWGANAMIW